MGGGICAYFLTDKKNTYRLVQESQISYTSPKKIAVLYISTGRYICFWNDFYTSAEKHFLPRHKKTYFLFTDHDDLSVPDNVVKIHQEQLPRPHITLKRYHFFSAIESLLKKFDYIYFVNGNTIITQDINEEIFPNNTQKIMVTLHPGFYRTNPRHVTYDRNPKSRAFIPLNQGTYYVMGGFNGGTAAGFLEMSKKLKAETDIDLNNGIIPRWHDESLLNRYVETQIQNGKTPLILLPVYGILQSGFSNMNEFRPLGKIKILDKSNYGGAAYLRRK